MENKISFFIGIVIILVFSQCNKIKLVPDAQGEPVFTIDAQIQGGEMIHFAAGLDSIIMATTFAINSDGVYTFIGEFTKKEGQIDSLASLRFEIRDTGINTPPLDVDDALMQAFYSYFNEQPTLQNDSIFRASFMASSSGCPQNLPTDAFFWEFEDSLTATGPSPTIIFGNANDRNVKLTLNYNNDLQTSTQQTLSFVPNTIPCGVMVSSAFEQNEIALTVVGTGTAPFSYQWYNNETSNQILMPLDTFSENFYSVTVTDASGCNAITGGDFTGEVGNSFCTTGFSYTTDIMIDTIPPSPQYSAVTIIYTDVDGNEYRSDLEEQTSLSSFFNILEVEDFANNENGQKTKKISIDFSCELFSNTQPLIRLQSSNAIIAVAYPD